MTPGSIRQFWLPRRLSVGLKFALITALLTAVVATISFGFILHRLRDEAAGQADAVARRTATRIVGTVQGVFDSALDIIKITNDELVAQRDKGVADPVVYDTILRHMIEAGTDRYGAWYVWKQGSWSPAKNSAAPTEEAGAYETYWHQNGMEMLQDRLPEAILDSDLYRVPAGSGHSVLLEPHSIDAVNGDPTLVTSFSRPLGDGGSTFGVIALDLKLDAVSDALSAIELPPDAKLTVVSDGGIVAMSTSKGLAGAVLSSVNPTLAKRLQTARKRDGSEFIAGDLPTLRTWSAIRFDGVKEPWYLFLELPEQSLLAAATNEMPFLILVPAIAFLALLGLVLLAMNRLVTKPLKALSTIIVGLGEGLFDFTIPERGRSDEVGDIARAVEQLQHSGLEIARLQEETGEEAYKRELQRKAELDELSAHFSKSIAALLKALGGVAGTVDEQSREVAQTMDDAVRRLEALSATTAVSEASMVSVATATSSLLSTIEAIGEQTRNSTSAAIKVEKQTASTAQSLSGLKDTVGNIDGVAKTISAIAGQINLIALNATIEAARAGEAGRGFTVVAQEIKTLALRTEKSTAEINAQIVSVNKASGVADEQVSDMTEAFAQMRAISSSIAVALDVQTQATSEIRGLINNALEGTDHVHEEVAELLSSSSRIKGAADLLLGQSGSLIEQIARLSDEADGFLKVLEVA